MNTICVKIWITPIDIHPYYFNLSTVTFNTLYILVLRLSGQPKLATKFFLEPKSPMFVIQNVTLISQENNEILILRTVWMSALYLSKMAFGWNLGH